MHFEIALKINEDEDQVMTTKMKIGMKLITIWLFSLNPKTNEQIGVYF